MKSFDIESEFGEMFPWHYSPLSKNTNDCPTLGNLEFDYGSLKEYVLEQCSKQEVKKSGKGFSHYFENGQVRKEIIDGRDEKFKKQFAVWLKSNWTLDNSCFYEFHDEELGDFCKPLLDAYEQKFGHIKNKQLRIFVKPPMTSLGLHADTFGTYKRKYNVKENAVFRVMTFVEDWEWGHYTLMGNEVCHQYRAGDSVRINPNVWHCSGNMGFNPQITMNITGTKE